MPKYRFECEDCNLQFTQNLKIGNHQEHACPECKKPAVRVLDSFSSQFVRNPDAPPGNTGVAKHDYPTADMAVGPEAEARWADYRRRAKVKDEVRKEGGTHKLIRSDGPGYSDYGAMTEGAAKGRAHVAKKAVEVLQSVEAPSKSLRELKQEANETR